mmetsp:Transcript_92927/g.268368  ORF Transcript_92927/g.268368 Transcript_92927/m.268368 type:complete len:232 (-) Transcript_92927:389-1084(-)
MGHKTRPLPFLCSAYSAVLNAVSNPARQPEQKKCAAPGHGAPPLTGTLSKQQSQFRVSLTTSTMAATAGAVNGATAGTAAVVFITVAAAVGASASTSTGTHGTSAGAMDGPATFEPAGEAATSIIGASSVFPASLSQEAARGTTGTTGGTASSASNGGSEEEPAAQAGVSNLARFAGGPPRAGRLSTMPPGAAASMGAGCRCLALTKPLWPFQENSAQRSSKQTFAGPFGT